MEMRKERGGERKRSKWIAGKAIFRYDFFFASVAQLVEQVTLNHLVLGSSPSRGNGAPTELGIERGGG